MVGAVPARGRGRARGDAARTAARRGQAAAAPPSPRQRPGSGAASGRGPDLKVQAFIGLGANLGDPRDQVRRAIAALGDFPRTHLLASSSLYRSSPVGVAPQPDFVNAVAKVETALSARELLEELLTAEARAGRERPHPGAPRTLDLDLLLYGDEVVGEPGLTVPHPRLHQRAFVRLPLAEIGSDLVMPGRGSLRTLLAACRGQTIQKIGAAP